jgi:cytochrome c oxidase assembly protein subunit 11
VNKKTPVYICLGILVAMTLIVALSRPLYDLFCKKIGLQGSIKTGVNEKILDRSIEVSFSTIIAENLDVEFTTPKPVEAKIGERKLVIFTAKNPSTRPIAIMSTFSILPYKAAQYMNKVQCFCFEKQIVPPMSEAHFPVSFFIEDKLAADKTNDDVRQMTLHYTVFEYKE